MNYEIFLHRSRCSILSKNNAKRFFFVAAKFQPVNEVLVLAPGALPIWSTGISILSHVADMVGRRLAAIPRSVAVRYWRQAVLGLYGYLFFERL